MKKPIKKPLEKSKRRIIAGWIGQSAVLFILVGVIWTWQTRHMVAAGELAPAISLTDLDGNPVSLDAALKRKVVLYFFAPWCSVCHASSHNINALRDAYTADELQIFAVGLSYDTLDELKQFAKKHGLRVPVLAGTEQTTAAYRVSSFPSVYILDNEHRIVHRLVGYVTEWGLRIRVALTGVI